MSGASGTHNVERVGVVSTGRTGVVEQPLERLKARAAARGGSLTPSVLKELS